VTIDTDSLARLALFADLTGPQLEALAHAVDEERHARGERVLREGFSGSAFYVILAGEAAVQIDGQERARLGAGEFFGDVSILTGEPVGADVVVTSEELRCGVLPGRELKPLLLSYPQLALRMLEFTARRLRNANRWSG
jgi:CRP/FNR family transcriptional regulator, cyclic AMP receptor protein